MAQADRPARRPRACDPATRSAWRRLDPAATLRLGRRRRAAPEHRPPARAAGRPPGPLLGGGEALGARRPAGHRRRRQGRHDQQGHGRLQPAGLPGHLVQGAEPEELAHDYLWRIHQAVPRKGEIGIFNRSHYEDVLVVRVHDLVPKAVWSKRYDQINDFERHPRRQRDDDRQVLPVDRPRRAAAALPGALRRPDQALEVLDGRPRGARAWDDYQAAFDDALSKTSTDGRRGTSSRPTASGSATWPSRRSWPTRSPASSRAIRRSPTTSRTDLVIE